MPLTVKSIMNIGVWRRCTVLAGGEGLGNIVTAIDSMEVPDISPWLRQGGMLITTGYPLKDSPGKLTELLADMSLAGCAAIAIKTRFIGPIPQASIDAANKYKIPLIAIPDDVPHIDLANPIIQCIGDQQRRQITLSLELHNRFMNLELNGGSFDAIANALSELIAAPVILLDHYGKIISAFPALSAQEGGAAAADIYAKHLAAQDPAFVRSDLLPDPRTLIKKSQISISENDTLFVIIRAALKKGRICGYTAAFCVNHIFDESDLMAIDHATKSISLEFLRTEATQEHAEQLDTSLFLEIVGNAFNENTIQRAKLLHWPSRPFIIAIFNIQNFLKMADTHTELELLQIKMDMRDIICGELLRNHYACKVFVMSDSLSCLIFINTALKDLLPVLENIHSLLQVRSCPASLAISGLGKGIDEMRACFHEAMDASYISRRIRGESRLISIDAYRFEQMLLHSCANSQFKAVYHKALAPVKAYDALNHTKLLETLYVYCSQCGSKQKTAERLYLHRNTLQYRLKKLESILDISLSDERNILNLAFLFKIKELAPLVDDE